MEVLVGPTFGIEVAESAAAFVTDRPQEKISSSFMFLKEDDVGGDDPTPGSLDVSSESSSSIGTPEDSDDEEEEGVVSSGGSIGLASLGSIEDSLPIKGLSNHFAGKSKSFGNLSDISSVKDLQKAENPFNKRRRVLIANKWSRKSSFYAWRNPNSMPLLALNEDDEDEDEDEEDKEMPSSSSSNDKHHDKISVAATKPKLQQSKLKATFKSQSCFSLTDLQVVHQ